MTAKKFTLIVLGNCPRCEKRRFFRIWRNWRCKLCLGKGRAPVRIIDYNENRDIIREEDIE